MKKRKKAVKHSKAYFVQKRKRRALKNKYKDMRREKSNANRLPYYLEYNINNEETLMDKIKISLKRKKFTATIISTVISLMFSMTPLRAYASQLDNQSELESETDFNMLDAYNLTDPLEVSTIIYQEPKTNNYLNLIDSNLENEENEEELESKIKDEEKVEEMRIEGYSNCIRSASAAFGFDGEKVVEAARFITNDYTEEIGLTIGNEEVTLDDADNFALTFVYKLYNNDLSEYGYEPSYFKNEEFEMRNICRDETDEIILENGYTFEEYFTYVCDKIGIDSDLALAISDYETGYQTSYQATTKNNMGGIRGKGDYYTFPTPEAGIIYMSMVVKRMLSTHNFSSLDQLSGVYVFNNINKVDPTWVKSVRSIYNKRTSENSKEMTLTLK